jgi:hypothetical protein
MNANTSGGQASGRRHGSIRDPVKGILDSGPDRDRPFAVPGDDCSSMTCLRCAGRGSLLGCACLSCAGTGRAFAAVLAE